MAAESLFQTSHDDLLISVYQKQGRTLDDLPYTAEFEAIVGAVGEDLPGEPRDSRESRARLFHQLHNLRKAGKLPRLGKAASAPLRIEGEHEAMLAELVEAAVGRLSLRDQLPYTALFDELVAKFNARAGLNLTPHDVWRLVAKLAK